MLIIDHQCIRLLLDSRFVNIFINDVQLDAHVILFYNFMEYFSFGRFFVRALDLMNLGNCEGGSHIYLTVNFDFTAHLFHYFLANTKAQTSSLTIDTRVLIQHAKINEQIF